MRHNVPRLPPCDCRFRPLLCRRLSCQPSPAIQCKARPTVRPSDNSLSECSTSRPVQTLAPLIGSYSSGGAAGVTAGFEDDALIELTLAGQTECFNVLVDRHQSAVRTRIRSMAKNRSDEDDLVQEVFFKAWRHLGSFRSEAEFRTWIIKITTNEVMQLYRRKSRNPLVPAAADLDSFASQLESAQKSLERVEATQIIRSAIAGLPAIYRQILLLELGEFSEAETAHHLKVSLSTVKTRRFRARRMLAAAVQRAGRRVLRAPGRTFSMVVACDACSGPKHPCCRGFPYRRHPEST